MDPEDTLDLTQLTDQLQGLQQQFQSISQRRIHQSDVLPKTISQRHINYVQATIISANNLPLPTNAQLVHITGTTQINLLNTDGFQAGTPIILVFDSALTVKHSQSASGIFKPILLSGSVDLSATANSRLQIVLDNTLGWLEVSRTLP